MWGCSAVNTSKCFPSGPVQPLLWVSPPLRVIMAGGGPYCPTPVLVTGGIPFFVSFPPPPPPPEKKVGSCYFCMRPSLPHLKLAYLLRAARPPTLPPSCFLLMGKRKFHFSPFLGGKHAVFKTSTKGCKKKSQENKLLLF